MSWPSWLDSAPAGSRTSDLSITSPTLKHCATKTTSRSQSISDSQLGLEDQQLTDQSRSDGSTFRPRQSGRHHRWGGRKDRTREPALSLDRRTGIRHRETGVRTWSRCPNSGWFPRTSVHTPCSTSKRQHQLQCMAAVLDLCKKKFKLLKLHPFLCWWFICNVTPARDWSLLRCYNCQTKSTNICPWHIILPVWHLMLCSHCLRGLFLGAVIRATQCSLTVTHRY